MHGMVHKKQKRPLVSKTLPLFVISKAGVIKIIASGVCRTDLHIIDA